MALETLLPAPEFGQITLHGELDEATRNVLAAFQMKYRPDVYDGEPDAQTAAMLLALTTQMSR